MDCEPHGVQRASVLELASSYVRERAGRQSHQHREHLHVRIQPSQVARREGRLYLQDTRLGRSFWRSWRELALKPSPSAIGCRPSARSSALFGDSQGRIGCFTDRDSPNPHHFLARVQSQRHEDRECNSATSSISTASPALGTARDQSNPSRAWLGIGCLIYDPISRPCLPAVNL
jgi:hypothetical protein